MLADRSCKLSNEKATSSRTMLARQSAHNTEVKFGRARLQGSEVFFDFTSSESEEKSTVVISVTIHCNCETKPKRAVNGMSLPHIDLQPS